MAAQEFSGLALRRTRVNAGQSPERLALAVGRSVYSIHEYERGRARPSVTVLGRLADALGCAVDDLFGEEIRADAR